MRLLVTVAAVLAALETTPQPQVRFRLSEAEVNRHVARELEAYRTSGLEKLTFKFFPANYVSTFTTIDFDKAAKEHPELMPAPVRLAFSGRKSLWVDFRFTATGGTIRAKVEKAFLGDVSVPPRVMESLLRLAASSDPGAYDIVAGVVIPWKIKTLATEAKTLTGHN